MPENSNNNNVQKQVCDIRHENIEKWMDKIDKNLENLSMRLNRFYVTAITTLVSALIAAILAAMH